MARKKTKKKTKKKNNATLTLRLNTNEKKDLEKLCNYFHINTSSGMIRDMISSYKKLYEDKMNLISKIEMLEDERDDVKAAIRENLDSFQRIKEYIN